MTEFFAPNAIVKAVRSFMAIIDTAVYTLLGFMYEIFFNVASADLFSNGTVLGFYKRVQLIIGVYMVFQLAILIIKGIINPENVSSKNNGEFVKRIIIALIMLTVMTPISIPNPQNEFEIQINNNGLLFGTLYSLQNRILSNNTIGRLVLGTNDTMTTTTGSNNSGGEGWYSGAYGKKSKVDDLTRSANVFTSTVLKGFLRINLVDKDNRKEVEDGKAPETLNANRMCKDIDDDTLDLYVSNDTAPAELLSLVNATCTPDTNKLTGSVYKALAFFGQSGKSKFVFAYMPLVSTIVGIIFTIIIISFTIDVSIRAIKLAVLRLIAPIPIISYMDPNGSKDGGFNAWVKSLTQTYLDLFIRLAAVFFVIYLIQDMIANGIYMNRTADAVGVLSFILICIGLFLFAKEAPKFIFQAIGIKNDPPNIFGVALGRAAAIAGVAGSVGASFKASREADKTIGGAARANNPWNVGKQLLAGMAGGVVGLSTGLQAVQGAKDHQAKAAMEAMQKRNAMDIRRGKSGSTFFGRIGTTGERLFLGEDKYERLSADLRTAKAQNTAAQDLFTYLEGKGKTDGAGWDVTTAKFEGYDAHGNTFNRTFHGTLNELLRKKQEAIALQQRGLGNGTFTFNGVEFNVTDAAVTRLEEELSYAAGTRWAEIQEEKRAKGEEVDTGYDQKKEDFETVGGVFVYKLDSDGAYSGVSKLKKEAKKYKGAADHIEKSKEYNRAGADHGATGGDK